jgi:penicillin-insensitive murein endopeptidase
MRALWAKMTKYAAAIAAMSLLATAVPQQAEAQELAKTLFGSHKLPAATQPQSIGFYSKGCFSGGVAIATDGPTWQAMRLSRNRRWGHPAMIALVEKLSRDAVQDGWPGLLLGDISQPRGGPMLTGHASHQIGLDADIWFTPMPDKRLTPQERENMSAVSLIDPKTRRVVEKRWTPAHARLLKRAASYPEVERILVHPGIKKKLCDTVTGDRSWLRKVRPFWGHDYHFHVRIGCQPGSPDCKRQEAVPAGEGCDKSLAWWFTEEPWRPNPNPDAPKARDVMTMSSLPKACRAVLEAPDPVSVASVTYPSGRATAITRADPIAAIAASGGLPAGASAFSPTPEFGAPLPFSRPAN